MNSKKINWKWIVGVGLAAMLIGVITGSTNISGPRCSMYAVDSAFDMYFDVGVRTNEMLDVSYESDQAGSDVDTDVELYICTGTNATDQTTDNFANCTDFAFDTNGDGVADSNVLTMGAGFAIEDIGVRGISGFQYLRVRRAGDVVDGAQEPVLTVCRRSF